MYVCAFIFCILVGPSLGFNPRPSYRSSVMDDQRPILRNGLDYYFDNVDKRPPPSALLRNAKIDPDAKTEPPWVSKLRGNIKNVIKIKGFNHAGGSIKKLIADADNEINKKPQAGRAPPLLSDALEDLELPSERGPKWMQKLKRDVKDLIDTFEKDELIPLLEPLVERIQNDYDVEIEGVDVDAYGKIDVSYKSRKQETPAPAPAPSDNVSPFGSGGMLPSMMRQNGMPPSMMGQSVMLPRPPLVTPGGMPPTMVGQSVMPPRPPLMGPSGMPPQVLRNGGMPPNMMGPGGMPPYFL